MVWYLVRRHLGFEIEQWEALPWHEQLVYLEGLEQEFYDPGDEEIGDEVDDTEDLSRVSAIGFQVRQVEAPVG